MSSENAVTKRPFGRQVVAAWFESVINPIIEGLFVEEERLNRKSWTWQFVPGSMQSFRHVRQMVPAGYGPNFDHFAEYHQDIIDNIKIHDEQVRDLVSACKQLERAILDSGELEKIFASVTTDEALKDLGKSLEEMFPGCPPSDRLGWIAQEVINGAKEIPSYYIHSPLWNRYQGEFMRVLTHPQVSEAKASIDRAGEKLLQTVRTLLKSLKDLRRDLSMEYDVPPVPTPSTMAA